MRDRITDPDVIDRFESYVEYDMNHKGCDRCTLSPINKARHRQFWVNGKVRVAHRVSYRIYVGPIPDEKQINHHCDNPWCVNPDHLYCGTQADNLRDARQRGHRDNLPGGIERDDCLDEADVITAFKLARVGVTQAEIGDLLGITQPAVSNMLSRKSYRSVDIDARLREQQPEPIKVRFASIHNGTHPMR